jgi:hypothetical protein
MPAGAERTAFAALVHDRMTEEVYAQPVSTFRVNTPAAPVFTVPLMAQGRKALESINEEMGLAFDEWDLDYYTALFKCVLPGQCTSALLPRHTALGVRCTDCAGMT